MSADEPKVPNVRLPKKITGEAHRQRARVKLFALNPNNLGVRWFEACVCILGVISYAGVSFTVRIGILAVHLYSRPDLLCRGLCHCAYCMAYLLFFLGRLRSFSPMIYCSDSVFFGPRIWRVLFCVIPFAVCHTGIIFVTAVESL